MKRETVRKAFVAALPVMAGYVVLGAAFGILLENKGYNFWWAIFMSIAIYAGSMQFVTVNLITGGASMISAALMTLMVNARHLFYGITMLTKYKNMGKAKPYLVLSLSDETFALVCNEVPEGADRKWYYVLVSFFNQCAWVMGSLAGSLIGSALTIDTKGIDFAMTALFIIIFTEQIIKGKEYVSAITGVVATVICLVLFGATNFLIPSMILIVTVLMIYGFYQDKEVW